MYFYFKNKKTGEIVHSKDVNEKNCNEFEGYSKINPELLDKETFVVKDLEDPVKDTKEFINIPFDFLIENLDRKELKTGICRFFNKEAYEISVENEDEDGYSYDNTVLKLFCEKYGIEGDSFEFLEKVISDSSYYRIIVNYNKKIEDFRKEIENDGFSKMTESEMETISKSKDRYIVYLDAYTMMGQETVTKSENKLRLKAKSDGSGYIWLPPRKRKNGFVARKGQYIKKV